MPGVAGLRDDLKAFRFREAFLSLLGEPETIDAAYIAPGHGKGVHALPGESLRGLEGDLTANLRFADGRAAGLAVSNQGARWTGAVKPRHKP